MRAIAADALGRMYRPEARAFAFRMRRLNGSDRLEGISSRYTAIVLIGLSAEPRDVVDRILGGDSQEAVCEDLIDRTMRVDNLGDTAVTLWAARSLGHSGTKRSLAKLRSLDPVSGKHTTVELAWTLTALSIDADAPTDGALAERVAERLLQSFRPDSGMFPHWPRDARPRDMRSHVACLADLVYPIQALAHHSRATGAADALAAARCCADHVCQMQGDSGQWWWHYDVRTGRVIERYPVYAVHQDAMAPMALFAVQKASGCQRYENSVQRGLSWLSDPTEIKGSLIDRDAGLIWRKVGRRERRKISRGLQAAASRLHPAVRVPGLDRLLPPNRIDFETRPYHMGWLLHAWAGRRTSRGPNDGAGGHHDHPAPRLAASTPL